MTNVADTDIVKIKDNKEDKVIRLFELLMDKLCVMEDRLKEKVDVSAFEELEGRMQQPEENMNLRVDELKERKIENEMKAVYTVS